METEKRNLTLQLQTFPIEERIKCIKKDRDLIIDELLNDLPLMAFLEEHFNTVAVSPIKLDLLKRRLQELKDARLDLVHYSSLVNEMEASLINHPKTNRLVMLELKNQFKKLGFLDLDDSVIL
jgi:hypothetical protein